MRPILEVDSVVSIQRGLGYWEELEGERRETSIFLFGAHRRIPMGAESAMQLSTGLARLVRQLLSFFPLVLVEYGSRLYLFPVLCLFQFRTSIQMVVLAT